MKNNKIYSKPKNGFCGVQNTPSKKDKVKNILSWLLICILCLTMCGSLLGTIAFSKDCKTAKADTVTYTFNGSNMFFRSAQIKMAPFPVSGGSFETVYGTRRILHQSFYPEYTEEEYILNEEDYIYYTIPPRPTSATFYLPNLYYNTSNTFISLAMDIQRRESENKVIGFNITNFEIYGASQGLPICYVSPETLVGQWTNTVGLVPNYGYPSNGMQGVEAVHGGYFYLDALQYNYFMFYDYKDFPVILNSPIDEFPTIPLLALMRVYVSHPNFNARIQKIEVGSYIPNVDTPLQNETFYRFWGTSGGSYYLGEVSTSYNYVRYYDELGYYFEYAIPVVLGDNYSQNNPSSLLYQNRTYYINSEGGSGSVGGGNIQDYDDYVDYYKQTTAFENDARRTFWDKWLRDYKDSNYFYNDAYNAYYNKFINSYKNSNDYKNAIDYAKEDGRILGLSQSNNFNFTTMLSAAINAPLSAFKDMINFELLGVNLLGLFTGLFTVAFVLFVVRKLT